MLNVGWIFNKYLLDEKIWFLCDFIYWRVDIRFLLDVGNGGIGGFWGFCCIKK